MGPSRKRLLRESELRVWDDTEGERAYDNSESRTWNSECGVDDSGSVDRAGLYNEGDVADDGSSLPRRQWSDSVVNGELYSGGGDSSAQHTRCDSPRTQHSEQSGPLSTSQHSPHNPAEMNHSQPEKVPYTDTLVPYETSQNMPQHEPQSSTQHTSFCENELHDMQNSAMETSFNDDQNQMYSDYRGEDLIVGDQESLYYGEDLIAGGSGGEQDFYQGSNLIAGVGDGGEDVYEDFAAGDGHVDYIFSYSDAQSSLADQALTDADVPEPSSSVMGKGEEDISLGREGADSSMLEGGDISTVEGADSSMVESVDNSTDERQGMDSFVEEGEGSNSMAVMPYMSPVGSLSLGSPCPSPPVSPPNRPGPSVQAAAATGVPLQPSPMTLGAPRFIPVHPVHVAAAVAAQRSRAAAALMQQHNRMAAAAVAAQQQQAAAVVAQQQQAAAQQRAAAAAVHQRVASAAVQQQAAAAAAAVHQQQAAVQRVAAAVHHRQAAAVAAQAQHRTRAALMQQQLVRSRYMGAPVLVRPPFLPAGPRVAAPIRVRMRVRRSVMMTEELSVDHP